MLLYGRPLRHSLNPLARPALVEFVGIAGDRVVSVVLAAQVLKDSTYSALQISGLTSSDQRRVHRQLAVCGLQISGGMHRFFSFLLVVVIFSSQHRSVRGRGLK